MTASFWLGILLGWSISITIRLYKFTQSDKILRRLSDLEHQVDTLERRL